MAQWVLGLTGGIGSGKTAASDYFASQGITVVDADVISREIVAPNEPAWCDICEHFGHEVTLANGELNRAWLRQTVFDHPHERAWLERCTHPRIRTRIEQQLNAASSPYAVLVSPLLIESQQSELVHRVLVVDVDESVQIARAAKRDNNDAEQIKKIIAAQMPRQKRLMHGDDVVNNDGDLHSLHAQLSALHTHYLAYAK